jgi:hypothetical protein
MHAWGITLHIPRVSRDVQRLEEGLPYPRCTVWNREAGSPSKRD